MELNFHELIIRQGYSRSYKNVSYTHAVELLSFKYAVNNDNT